MMESDNGSDTKYREMLQALEHESQRAYDKTVLTLSGGALGVSFAFVKDIIGEAPIVWKAFLLASWVFWGLSVTCVLLSFFLSQRALHKAIDEVDEKIDEGKTPKNYYDTMTRVLNVLGGFLFFTGVISMVVFAAKNMG